MGRLVMAFIGAPLILGAVVTLAAFLIAGMSEPTTSGVIRVTLNAAMTLVPMLFLFLLTFGAAGILVLWYLGQRGMLAWAVCGALAGVLGILLVGEVLLGRVERPMLIAAALVGWTMFLLFRWIARIRNSPIEESH